MRSLFVGLLLLAPGLLLPSNAASAQSSATSISFQGALNGANGQPLPNANHTLVFQFWDHPTATAASNRVGGAVTVPGVEVSDGIASTAIPVDPAWFNGQTRYLGVTVQGINGGQELLPRVLVTAVPYAVNALQVGGGIVRLGTNGTVGINTPATKATLTLGRFNGAHIAMEGGSATGTFSYDGFEHNQFLLGVFRESNGESHGFLSTGYGTTDSPRRISIGRASSASFSNATFAPVLTVMCRNISTGQGAVGIGTTTPTAMLDVNGTTRTTVLQITSARAAKEGFVPVDAAAVLAKVAALPIATWAYTNRHGVRHLGPVAEDFHAAFALGDSAQHIATVDADGVALAAIQGLHRLVQERDVRIAALEKELTALKSDLFTRLAALEERGQNLGADAAIHPGHPLHGAPEEPGLAQAAGKQ